jgi:hypothetical protein
MFPINVKASEQIALLAAINPVSQGAGNAVSGWVSAKDFNKFLALVQVGVFGASATIDANIKQATSNAGAGAKNIGSGRAIVQQLAAGGNNIQCLIDLDAGELDVEGGFTFIQFTITVGTAATLVAGALFGFIPRNAPGSALNATSVTNVVG